MRSGKRTYRHHQSVWDDTLAQMNGIIGVGEQPEHYFRTMAASINNFEFLSKSRRGVNFSASGSINLRDFYLDTALDLTAECEKWCIEAKRYMQANHPWNNRTGNAERGLNAAIAGIENGEIVMYLYHSVPYGKYLEGENGFRYPYAGLLHIIEPTIQEFGPQLMYNLQGILER